MTAALALLLFAAPPDAGASLSLDVQGDLVKPGPVSMKALTELGVTVEWTDTHQARTKSGEGCVAPARRTEQGCRHRVTGARLDGVLFKLGFSEGPSGPGVEPTLKHRGLRAAIVATAADGYQAVFSAGELLEQVGPTNALLVWEMDGAPLPVSLGPLRLLVLTDQGASRSLHRLVSLRVVDLSAH